MPITIKWKDNKNTTMVFSAFGEWSWNDLPDVRNQCHELIRSVDHKVDIIADFREVNRIPPGALSVWRSAWSSRRLNEGVVIVVGTSPILSTLYRSFTTAFPHIKDYYLLADTIEKAEDLIATIQQNRNSSSEDILQD